MAIINEALGPYEQDQGAVLDYSSDWTDLLIDGDTIASSEWSADAGLALTLPAVRGALTVIFASGGVPGTHYRITNTVTTAQGRRDARSFYLFVKDGGAAPLPFSSALFVSRFAAVQQLKRDRLAMVLSTLSDAALSDDYLWEKLLAAEAEVRGIIGVPLQPTEFFAGLTPTDADAAALAAQRRPYQLESALDMPAWSFGLESQPVFRMRERPLIAVTTLRVVLPGQNVPILDVPQAWMLLDAKGGMVSVIPRAGGIAWQAASPVATAFMGGGRFPSIVQVRYTAGLSPSHPHYRDLLDVVQRLAVVKIFADAMLPQSGSISADGLSQSSSVDAGKYQEAVDATLATLRESILGPVWGVL